MASARLRPPCLPPKGKRVRIQNFARPAGEWDEANENPRHNHQRSGSTGSPLIGSCDAARLRTCFRWDSSCANASNARRGSRRKSAAKLEWLFGIANRTPGRDPLPMSPRPKSSKCSALSRPANGGKRQNGCGPSLAPSSFCRGHWARVQRSDGCFARSARRSNSATSCGDCDAIGAGRTTAPH
jgi:hypothetical protein